MQQQIAQKLTYSLKKGAYRGFGAGDDHGISGRPARRAQEEGPGAKNGYKAWRRSPIRRSGEGEMTAPAGRRKITYR